MEEACCVGHDAEFGAKSAARAAKRYRKKGAEGATRALLDLMAAAGVDGDSHLDVGGGIGVVQHELAAAGVTAVVHVDGSQAHLDTAAELARERATGADRRGLHGDYVALASEAGPADIVTLDKVICCYPAMARLVDASAGAAGRWYGVVYPRDRRIMRALLPIGRWILARTSGADIGYMHRPAQIRARIEAAGLRLRSGTRDFIWHIELYHRA